MIDKYSKFHFSLTETVVDILGQTRDEIQEFTRGKHKKHPLKPSLTPSVNCSVSAPLSVG